MQSSIPLSLWVLNGTLSSGMFFGLAIINAGSEAFQWMICAFGCVLIGLFTFSIADLDNFSKGSIKVSMGPLIGLVVITEGVLGGMQGGEIGRGAKR